MPRPRESAAARRIYDAIVAYHQQTGQTPSQEEIGEIAGRSRGAVRKQLDRLIEAGVIKISLGKHRSIQLVGEM